MCARVSEWMSAARRSASVQDWAVTPPPPLTPPIIPSVINEEDGTYSSIISNTSVEPGILLCWADGCNSCLVLQAMQWPLQLRLCVTERKNPVGLGPETTVKETGQHQRWLIPMESTTSRSILSNLGHWSQSYLEKVAPCAAQLRNHVHQGGGGWVHWIWLQDERGVFQWQTGQRETFPLEVIIYLVVWEFGHRLPLLFSRRSQQRDSKLKKNFHSCPTALTGYIEVRHAPLVEITHLFFSRISEDSFQLVVNVVPGEQRPPSVRQFWVRGEVDMERSELLHTPFSQSCNRPKG